MQFPRNHRIFCRVIKTSLPYKNGPPRNQRPGFNYSHQVLSMYQGIKAQAGSLQILSGVTLSQPRETGMSARNWQVGTLSVREGMQSLHLT